MRDVVTKWRRLPLAGLKTKNQPCKVYGRKLAATIGSLVTYENWTIKH